MMQIELEETTKDRDELFKVRVCAREYVCVCVCGCVCV